MNIRIQNQDQLQNQLVQPQVTQERSSGAAGIAGFGAATGVGQSLGAVLEKGFDSGDHAYGQKAAKAAAGLEMSDAQAEQNRRVLLSQTMSPEDYAKAQENGFDLKDTDPRETVTIMDHIKVAVAQGGTEVAGFSDAVDHDTLVKITGSEARANELTKAFEEQDVPLTKQHAEDVQQAAEAAQELGAMDPASIRMMVQQERDPSIQELYLAQHSSGGSTAGGSGYYADAAGGNAGYYAQKADNSELENLAPQIDQTIQSAGYETDNQKAQQLSRELIREGVPFTAETLDRAMDLAGLELPPSFETVLKAGVAAIADGKSAMEGNLADPVSLAQKAVQLEQDTRKVSDAAVEQLVGKEIPMTLRALFAAESSMEEQNAAGDGTGQQMPQTPELLTARRQLEEVRLSMSADANLKLLQNGVHIDTAPMEDLIRQLKSAEASLNQTYFGAPGSQTAVRAAGAGRESGVSAMVLFNQTMYKRAAIQEAPAGLVGAMADEFRTDTLDDIYDKGQLLKLRYDKAGQSYEQLMTAPRADMGDSIGKAFTNVDAILEDLELATNEENRRAVRILGYNSMELTPENIDRVKSVDAQLRSTVERLKPAAVLQMIREGRNPLKMTIGDLQEFLNSHQEESGASEEKYAKFLYKLEKNADITSEEKTSYIGIYRLFHDLNRSGNAAIGTLLQENGEMTLGNLLTAERTRKRSAGRGMDFRVDDAFGGVEAQARGPKIDEQIETAFRYYSAKADSVYEHLDADKLEAFGPTQQTLLPELAEALEAPLAEEQLQTEAQYRKQQLETLREAVLDADAEAAEAELKQEGLPLTQNHLESVLALRAGRRRSGKGPFGVEKNDVGSGDHGIRDALRQTSEVLREAMDTPEDFREAYTERLQVLQEQLPDPEAADNLLDLKAISLMHKQISTAQQLAESNSYEIPVEVDGETISMHVTFADAEGGSRMEASMETAAAGTVVLSLGGRNGSLSGRIYTTADRTPQVQEYCEGIRQSLMAEAAKLMPEAGTADMDVIYGSYKEETQPGTGDVIPDRTMLMLAKAFAGAAAAA